MAGLLPPVIATLIADTKEFMAKMDGAQAKMGEFGAESDVAGSKLTNFADKASTAVLGLGVAVGVTAVKLAYDYNEALDSMRTQTDLTTQQVDQLSPQILKISTASATSASQIATAYTQVIKAGIPLNQVQKDVGAAAEFANAQQASLTDTLTAALNIQKLHILGTKNMSQTMDIFTNAVQHSRLTGEDLNTAMSGKFINTLQAYGISLQEGTVLLAGFANEGRTGTRATQVLQTGIANLEKPTVSTTGKLTAAGKVLQQYGINQQTLADDMHKPGGIINVLQYLDTSFEKSASSAEKAKGITAWLNQIVGSQAGGAFSGLIGQLPELLQMMNQVNTAGSNQSAFQKWLSTPTGALKNFTTSVENALIPIGNFILPVLSKAFNDAAKAFNSKSFVSTFESIGGAILAGMAGYKLATIGTKIASGFGIEAEVLAGPIGLAIAGIILTAIKGNIIPQIKYDMNPPKNEPWWKKIANDIGTGYNFFVEFLKLSTPLLKNANIPTYSPYAKGFGLSPGGPTTQNGFVVPQTTPPKVNINANVYTSTRYAGRK